MPDANHFTIVLVMFLANEIVPQITGQIDHRFQLYNVDISGKVDVLICMIYKPGSSCCHVGAVQACMIYSIGQVPRVGSVVYGSCAAPQTGRLIRCLRFTKLCRVGEHINVIMKPTNSPTQGQPNPRKNRLEVAFGPLFPHSK